MYSFIYGNIGVFSSLNLISDGGLYSESYHNGHALLGEQVNHAWFGEI